MTTVQSKECRNQRESFQLLTLKKGCAGVWCKQNKLPPPEDESRLFVNFIPQRNWFQEMYAIGNGYLVLGWINFLKCEVYRGGFRELGGAAPLATTIEFQRVASPLPKSRKSDPGTSIRLADIRYTCKVRRVGVPKMYKKKRRIKMLIPKRLSLSLNTTV